MNSAPLVPGISWVTFCSLAYDTDKSFRLVAESLSPPTGTIRIAAKRQDGRVCIEIEDDGPGIGEDKLEAIFDRFYSERPEEDGFGNHSGLGLNICKQIVTVHSGEIWAENVVAPGDLDRDCIGAKFMISLPATTRSKNK